MFRGKEKIKKELWQRAEDALFTLYGEKPDARILKRFYSEKKIFEETDAIIVWSITADVRLEAKLCGHLTNLNGTDSSCLVAYLMGASDIDPLELHYRCSVCGKIEFIENKRALPFDIADKPCECGHTMRADGFDIPYEMHIGRTKAHLTVAPQVIEMAENTVKERAREFYSDILRIEGSDSASYTYIFGEKNDGKYPGIVLVASDEYGKARKLTEVTGIDFEEVLMGISEHYLSDRRLISEIAKGNTDGVLGFDFCGHPLADRLKEDLITVSPQSSYDLLKFFGAIHGTRNWLYNADALVKNGVCRIGELPSLIDDVLTLLRDGAELDADIAFNITNKIREGLPFNGLTANGRGLPTWFVPYVKRVRYMSSKAAVIGAFRIALVFVWFKVTFPDKVKI